ncbi:leucine-rich repeat extensin-like protein 5 [Diaphorina citri]|uniref:Leucine-rich repeat extensin-like protein 5 n=1 Tax=Diaphorina citri TaxID=121845 RepID=A0A3Q0J346_DIACI|nr:leucine-rich repeat extensin-like protein 5 [Diaphorina citri]
MKIQQNEMRELKVDKLRLPHECTICRKLVTASRRLLRSHASQYGVAEDDIPIDARVCVSCRASRRNRFTCCPIPSCVNHTTNRAKRLRLLPSKFHSLPPHLKSTLANEFPEINRRHYQVLLAVVHPSTEEADDPWALKTPSSRPVSPSGGSTPPYCLRECGTKWTAVSAIVGPSKTSHQCKSFYFNYRKTLGLDVLVQEYNKCRDGKLSGIRTICCAAVSAIVGPSKTSHQCKSFYFNYRKTLGLDVLVQDYNKNHFGTERKPALTDEEESGSSTSSCDGLPSGVGGSGALIDSDTTSAPSPSQQGPKPSPLCPPRISESSDTTVSTHRGTPTRPTSASQSRCHRAPWHTLQEAYLSAAHLGRPQFEKHYFKPSLSLGTVPETADEGTTEHPSTNSPLTVKDLMLGVIEISLKNSQGGTPSSDANTKNNPPTISSILKTSESTGAGAPPPNLPPLAPPPPQSKPLSMVREAEPVTLDLSIKKPRGAEPTYPPTNKPALSLPHPVMYRAAPDTSNYYHSMMEVGRPQQAPNEVYGAPGSHLVMAVPGAAHLSVSRQPNTPSHMKPNKVRITSLSPSQHQQNRMSPSQGGGSSTSGSKLSLPPGSRTSSPRHQAPPDRYQESHHPGHTIKDMHGGHAMKESPGGSITQGTPVHSRLYPPPPSNERGAPPPPEFYGKPPSGPPNPAHRSSGKSDDTYF